MRSAIATSQPAAPLTGNKTEPNNRICIGIALEVSGTDLNGQDFVERTHTEHVSRNGAGLLLNRFLGPDQQVTLRRRGSRFETTARVVGQLGIRSHGHVYGISLSAEDNDFWGVHFPPGCDQAAIKVIRCSCCLTWESAHLDEVEAEVLEANRVLSRPCLECHATTFWQVVGEQEQAISPNRDTKPDSHSNQKAANRRRNARMAMKASACLCQPTGLRDVAHVLDVSRGGVSFRSSEHYTVHSWVELAVPYTEGGANIFVPGRIVWERTVGEECRDYGVQYVRN
jgi:hypothetical protein